MKKLAETHPHVARRYDFVLTKKKAVTGALISFAQESIGVPGSSLSYEKFSRIMELQRTRLWLLNYCTWADMVRVWAAGGRQRFLGRPKTPEEEGPLSSYDDPEGYGGKSLSAAVLRGLGEYEATRKADLHAVRRMMDATHEIDLVSIDTTFETAHKIRIGGGGIYDGVVTVTNRIGQIIMCICIQGNSLRPVLDDLKRLNNMSAFWRRKARCIISEELKKFEATTTSVLPGTSAAHAGPSASQAGPEPVEGPRIAGAGSGAASIEQPGTEAGARGSAAATGISGPEATAGGADPFEHIGLARELSDLIANGTLKGEKIVLGKTLHWMVEQTGVIRYWYAGPRNTHTPRARFHRPTTYNRPTKRPSTPPWRQARMKLLI